MLLTPTLGRDSGPGLFYFVIAFFWALFFLEGGQCSGQGAAAQQQAAASSASSEAFSATGIGTGTRPISGLWQFHLGDDPAWAQPAFDDHAWEQLPADQPWGDAGHPAYTGFAWYRRQIALDPTNRKPLALLLPPLGSVAEVYWNGVKIGGIGTPPPHASWPKDPQPVAVPLPVTAGATSGALAIRLWMHRLGSNDARDAGGFQAAPLLGYRPLIEKMPRQSAEHYFATRAIINATVLLFFFFAVAALVLWARARSQWLLLSVAGYLGGYAANILFDNLPLSFAWSLTMSELYSSVIDISFLCLLLLLSDLPARAGIRGARFWWRASLALAAIVLFGVIESLCQVAMSGGTSHPALFHFLDWSSEYTSVAFVLYLPVLLVACFVLSRLTWPRLLFLAAVSLQNIITTFVSLTAEEAIRVEWLRTLLLRPFLVVYGAKLTLTTTARLVVLVAIVFAVWDQLSKQVARQRFVDDELKAAREIQQILVPAAAERQAPGFAVSSIYRPASEVGGDFFQIIPLQGGSTLIVAGDVSGKGLRAAMTVSLVVGALRTLAEYDSAPAAVLAGLNRRLLGRTQGGFVTCCAIQIDASGHATMANAGHCQPYLDSLEVEMPNGLPLGIAEDVEYEEIAMDVSQGQQLTLLSDGVVEARNPHGELYGFDRLNHLMQQRPTAEHIADTAVGFGQDDDITVLTVTRLAPA